MESQLVDLADEIAYNNHDIDDAMKMGLLHEQDLREVDWVWEVFQGARRNAAPASPDKFVKYRVVGTLINMQVSDALATTESNIEALEIRTLDDVRRQVGKRIAAFSPEMRERNRRLKEFLMRRVYKHPRVRAHEHESG